MLFLLFNVFDKHRDSMLFLLFNVFDKHREKYTKLDFVKFISLEINYSEETSCFCFLEI